MSHALSALYRRKRVALVFLRGEVTPYSEWLLPFLSGVSGIFDECNFLTTSSKVPDISVIPQLYSGNFDHLQFSPNKVVKNS